MAKMGELGGDLEDALDRVRVPSYVYDRHGVIRWVNRAGLELVGDVRGRQITSVVAPEETRLAQEAYLKHIYSDEDVEAQVVLLDEKGNRVSVEVSSVCLHSGHHVIGVFGQLSDVHEVSESPPHPHLTPRQAQVLRLLEHGRSTEQIADELHLSIETVRNHIRRLLRALDVHSRLEAVAVGRRLHLEASSIPEG
ncbi:MAG TPA: LuxR C-terminal-related transcriptional regulator [Gaiellaceae bacterium]|nr:LuxR C-terminal-related transcriptional regulator [Gaiellaceae bacterium]